MKNEGLKIATKSFECLKNRFVMSVAICTM